MYRLIAALVCLLWAPSALAQSFVVWMEAEVPDEKAVKRADKLTGGSNHLSHVDLAFPPQPATDEDKDRFDKLRKAISEGQARWDEFDVEIGIAQELQGIIDVIDVLRDERDLQDLVQARLFQGAAVNKGFDPASFPDDETAAPFRVVLSGVVANLPWVQAMALQPDRVFTRADIADGSAFPDLQKLIVPMQALEPGFVDLTELPKGTVLYLDGREADVTNPKLSVRPGRHFFHVMRKEVVGGRQIISVDSAESVPLPIAVNRTALEQTRLKVLEGTTNGLPQEVKDSIETLSNFHEGAIFVAAVSDKGAVTVLPYARGAQLLKEKVVTVVAAGEVGGGAVISTIFDQSTGNNITAPAVDAHLGLEIGVYNVAVLGGCDLAIVPGNTVTHGPADETDTDSRNNVSGSALWQPWGGLGLYAVRPTGTTPTLLIAATYGWDFPAHMAFGGRITFGALVDQGTWFRLTLGANTSPKSQWDEGDQRTPLSTVFLRFGLGTLF
jgi:hypothetical protein